jgi:hypothetical protein
VVPGKVEQYGDIKLYVIDENEQHLLKKNGCDRIHFRDFPDSSLDQQFLG